MVFEPISRPDDILQLQNSIEDIFVSNVLRQRRLAIGQALTKAKKLEDIPKFVDIPASVSHGLDFIWQQGMYAGVKHAENEIKVQIDKGTNAFSLSYGFNDIIEFAGRKRRSKKEIESEKLQNENIGRANV